MTRRSTAATNMARISAAALGVLLCVSAYATPAADAVVAQYRPSGAAPGFSAPGDESLPGPLARLDSVFGQNIQLSSFRARRNENEIVLRNSDALLRAKLRLTLGKEWLFVYGDMGPADSTLTWQGLVGIRVGRGASLLGGWRRVTYYLSPGRDFNSLEFDGPFIGAQRAW